MYFAKSASSSLLCSAVIESNMINLAIDIGNTFAKAGFFEDERLLSVQHQLNPQALTDLLKNTSFQAVIVSSVAKIPDQLIHIFSKAQQVIFLEAATRLPFQNLYTTPETLGTDRIAAVAGASSLFPKKNVLAIDTGTCITYDLIDKKSRYQGGAISPGLQMRLKAMHTFTARLPLLKTDDIPLEDIHLTGKSTRESMLSGTIYGMGSEITQMIRMYARKFADLQVVTCGGDASYLAKVIQQEHVMIPELILIGLNRILIYNVS